MSMPTTPAEPSSRGSCSASYRYVGLKTADDVGFEAGRPSPSSPAAKRAKGVERGAEAGRVIAGAAAFARELANTPPTYLNAKDIAAKAVELGPDAGLTVEVFNKDDLAAMGCGGIIGVNRGSTEPPRMVKLTYSPRNPKGHLAMVGKGIMYDSGGISLKPSDAFHQVMKMDMSGAAAVLVGDVGVEGARLPFEGDRMADVHRQHALGLGVEAR